MRLIFSLMAWLIFTTTAAEAARDLNDHPLVSPYEGSKARRKDVKEFDEYQLITGTNKKEFSGPTLEGKVTRLFYDNPKDRSLLEMIRNYEAALKKSGAEILFQCDQKKLECIERYAGPTFQKHSNIHAMSNLDGRFMSARLTQGDQTAYIVIAVGHTFTDIHVVEIKNMDTGMAALNAAALGEGIDRNGYVIVEGIYFDTDKTTLKPASKPALEEVAALLKKRHALSLYVVGHTAMHGSLAHNRSLSEGRAKAVVKALTGDYGVTASRLEGYGVGPLAPQAGNATESGRAKNRRVVLVAR